MAARAPVGAVVGSLVAVAQLGLGLALLAWVLTTHLAPAHGFELAAWAAGRSPVTLPGTPEQMAETAVTVQALWIFGVGGAILAALGLENAWKAHCNFKPANESNNGKARLELKAPARLGSWLEGEFVLLKGAQVGDAYDVRLGCSRRVLEREANRDSQFVADTRYDQRVHAKAVPSAGGLKVPFRFGIPASMPASGTGGVLENKFQWAITVGTPNALFPTKFALDVQPWGREDPPVRDAIPDPPPGGWTKVEPTRNEAARFAAIANAFQMSPRVGQFLVGVVALFFVVLCVIIALKVLAKWTGLS